MWKKQSFLTLILIRNGCKNVIDRAYTFTHNFAKNSFQESVDPALSLRKIVLSHYAHYMMFTQCLEWPELPTRNLLQKNIIVYNRKTRYDMEYHHSPRPL